jgi:hypothetical protein
MRINLFFPVILAVAACGTDPSGDPGPDAVAGPPVTIDVTCSMTRYTAIYPDGRKTLFDYSTAVLDVGPEDIFAIETCELPVMVSCPAGATCTGDPSPFGQPYCSRSYRSGSFVNGKLTVLCGYVIVQYAANGSVANRSEWTLPGSMKLIKY